MSLLRMLEKHVRVVFLPISTRITVRLRRGIAAGLRARGVLAYSNLMKKDDKESLFLKSLDYKGKVVYDIGGFIGLMSIFFASRAGAAGRVYTFEPNPHLHGLVERNRDLNRLDNLTAFKLGLGDRAGVLELAVSPYHLAMGSLRTEHRRSVEKLVVHKVPVVRLDDFVKAEKLPPPDFVKMDVEGFEGNVLRGMRGILTRHKPALFIEVHGFDDYVAVYEFLLALGYAIRHVEADEPITKANIASHRFGHVYCEAVKRPVRSRANAAQAPAAKKTTG